MKISIRELKQIIKERDEEQTFGERPTNVAKTYVRATTPERPREITYNFGDQVFDSEDYLNLLVRDGERLVEKTLKLYNLPPRIKNWLFNVVDKIDENISNLTEKNSAKILNQLNGDLQKFMKGLQIMSRSKQLKEISKDLYFVAENLHNHIQKLAVYSS